MKRLITLISFLFFCVLTLSAKPTISFNLINSFPIDVVQKEWITYKLCVADTLLLVLDTADSTNTKSLAYDFYGNKIDTFRIPTDSTYGQFFFVNYLYDTKRVAVCGTKTCKIDYYNLAGNPLGSKELQSDWSLYLNTLEYNAKPYYIVFNLREAEYGDMVTGAMTWCREKDDGEIQLLRKECIIKDWLKINKSKRPFEYKFLMDNNKDQFMTMVDERATEYVITYPDSTGWNISRIKRRKNEYISHVITGENYFILLTWDADLKYTKTSGIYNKSGIKIMDWSELKQCKTKGIDIIDIVGDKMLTCNYKDREVRVYQVNYLVDK